MNISCGVVYFIWNRNLFCAIHLKLCIMRSFTYAWNETILSCVWICLYIIKIVHCSTAISQGINFYIFYIYSHYLLDYALPSPGGHKCFRKPLGHCPKLYPSLVTIVFWSHTALCMCLLSMFWFVMIIKCLFLFPGLVYSLNLDGSSISVILW